MTGTTSTKDDEKPLIPSQEHVTDVQIKQPSRNIIVEPIILLYFAASIGSSPLITEYINDQIGKQYNFTPASTGYNNDPCNITNENSSAYKLQQQIQGESSIFLLYLTICSGVPAVFSGVYLGGYTDQKGRKPGLLLSLFGSFLKMLLFVVVIYSKLNIYFLFIGAGLDGMCGYFSTFITACFSYISDTTTPEQRPTRIAICEICMAVGSAASAGFGFWLNTSGYLGPMILVTGLLFLCLIYTFFFVPETIVQDSRRSVSVITIAKNAFRVSCVTAKESGRPWKLFLLLQALLLIGSPIISSYGVQALYYMNSPFCFKAPELGLYFGISAITSVVGSVLGILFFIKCLKLSDMTVALIATILCVIRFIMFGIANSRLLLWLAIPVGMVQTLHLPMLRARMSKLVSASEQGSLFAGIAANEVVVCYIVGTLLWNITYTGTLNFYKGFVFLIMALTNVIAIIIIGFMKYVLDKDKQKEVTKDYGSINKRQ